MSENLFMQKYRVIGEYVLSPNEELSQDGDAILCKVCGKRKYESFYSPILSRKVWALANNSDRQDALTVGDGCNCKRDARAQRLRARDDYDNPEFEIKDGKIEATIRGRRNFSRDYGMDWMLSAVPEWGRFAQIEDRYYFQECRYSSVIEVMRLFLETIESGCDWNNDLFIYGNQGTLKTSILCCFRYALLSNTKPTIMVNVRQVIAFIARTPSFAEQLEKVDVLLIDDLGKATLTDRQSKMFEGFVRARANKTTIYASQRSMEGLMEKGYGMGLLNAINARLGDMMAIDMEGGKA